MNDGEALTADTRMEVRRYLLPLHVYFCLVDGSAIFLDLKRDRYFGLSPSQAHMLRCLAESNMIADAQARNVANGLTEQGLLTLDSGAGKPVVPIDIERVDTALVSIDMPAKLNVRPGHVANFIIAYMAATVLLRWCSLDYAVRHVRDRKLRLAPGRTGSDTDAVRDLVRVFRRLRPLFYQAHRKCLLDSLVLIEFLARYGFFPSWVIAVRTMPFAAHSWVQHGSAVFNDVPQFIGAYTPIASI